MVYSARGAFLRFVDPVQFAQFVAAGPVERKIAHRILGLRKYRPLGQGGRSGGDKKHRCVRTSRGDVRPGRLMTNGEVVEIQVALQAQIRERDSLSATGRCESATPVVRTE